MSSLEPAGSGHLSREKAQRREAFTASLGAADCPLGSHWLTRRLGPRPYLAGLARAVAHSVLACRLFILFSSPSPPLHHRTPCTFTGL